MFLTYFLIVLALCALAVGITTQRRPESAKKEVIIWISLVTAMVAIVGLYLL